jgi:hypothetical protein
VREDDIAPDSLVEVEAAQARRGGAQEPTLVDPVDATETEAFELPGADLSDVALVVEVRPQQADEFTCLGCYLVRHRCQLVDPVRRLCVDCA